jgi:hypothetical protein
MSQAQEITEDTLKLMRDAMTSARMTVNTQRLRGYSISGGFSLGYLCGAKSSGIHALLRITNYREFEPLVQRINDSFEGWCNELRFLEYTYKEKQ